MSIFKGKFAFAVVLALSCPSAPAAYAQAAPLRYWVPGGLFGFGANLSDARKAEGYRNFPSFDAADMRGSDLGFDTGSSGWFVAGERSSFGLSQIGAFGNFGAPSLEGVQFGYNFKGAGGMPVTFHAGFDTLKYDAGAAGALAPFSSGAMTAPGYGVNAGFEIKPTSNLSLSFGVGYTQLQSGRVDSDINSTLLPGESPMFAPGRR